MPAPMMAPTPSAIRFHGPRTFLSWWPSSSVPATSSSRDLVAKRRPSTDMCRESWRRADGGSSVAAYDAGDAHLHGTPGGGSAHLRVAADDADVHRPFRHLQVGSASDPKGHRFDRLRLQRRSRA